MSSKMRGQLWMVVVGVALVLGLSNCGAKHAVAYVEEQVTNTKVEGRTTAVETVTGQQQEWETMEEQVALSWWGGDVADSVRTKVPQGGVVVRRQQRIERHKASTDTVQERAVHEGTMEVQGVSQVVAQEESVVQPSSKRGIGGVELNVLFILLIVFLLWRYYSE